MYGVLLYNLGWKLVSRTVSFFDDFAGILFIKKEGGVMNTCFDRTTAGFCTKIIDFIPRELTHERMKHLETSGELRKFLKILSNEETLSNVMGVERGTHEIIPIKHILDFSVLCELPFNGAERVVSSAEDKVVTLELLDDELHLDGKRLTLYRAKKQRKGVIKGEELRRLIEKRGGNTPASLIDYLKKNPHLWPEQWKKDLNGNTIYVFCWGDTFRDPSSGSLYVRCAFWGEGRVVSYGRWLESDWRGKGPAAVLAS